MGQADGDRRSAGTGDRSRRLRSSCSSVVAFAANLDVASYERIGRVSALEIFALVNSGVSLGGAGLTTLAAPDAMGTALSLFLGNQLGIFASTALAVRLGFAPMRSAARNHVALRRIIVAGIAFTVALFIATPGLSEAPQRLAEARYPRRLARVSLSAPRSCATPAFLRPSRPKERPNTPHRLRLHQ